MVLDCDMYCNNPTSAKQAMCFHLDPEISPFLAFVQFPQTFYNVHKNDIYDGQGRSAYKTKWQGMDGLQDPLFTGTGYYLKKKALFCRPTKDELLLEPGKDFGLSQKFIASLKGESGENEDGRDGHITEAVVEEAKTLASCTFEQGTKWGREIGYSYDSMLESTFTGYLLHCKGWRSVYLYPSLNLKGALVQQMKWISGSLQVGLSKFSPLVYASTGMSILQRMCYCYFFFYPLLAFAFLVFGLIPQVCLLSGIPLYPELSSPWFVLFAFVFTAYLCQHQYEVLSTGGTFTTWMNEHRMWLVKKITSSLFGCLDQLLKLLGLAEAKFRLTNKAVKPEKLKNYEKGRFNSQGADLFNVPLVVLSLSNLACLAVGVMRVISHRNVTEMFGQLFLSIYILLLSFSILEDLVSKIRKVTKVM